MTIQHKNQPTTYRPTLAVIMAIILTVAVSACTLADPRSDVASAALPGQTAPRLQNLGNHQFPVTTNSARAQLFINQGMMLTYGFNHAEATRSFREAARLDPDCAMAYWGMALVLGPNINMAMPPEAEPQAYLLIQKATALQNNVSEKERALCRCRHGSAALELLDTRYAALPGNGGSNACAGICT